MSGAPLGQPVRRIFAFALRDVLPLDEAGWRVWLHTPNCPDMPHEDLLSCRGRYAEILQLPTVETGLRDGVVGLARAIAKFTGKSTQSLTSPPPGPPGFASFGICSAPIDGSDSEEERHRQFQESFSLLQRGVDALRLATSSPVPPLTIERVWPLYMVLTQDAAGAFRTDELVAVEHGQFWSTRTAATQAQMEQARRFFDAGFRQDPVELYRDFSLRADNAAHVAGDYVQAVLQAAAAAEVLIKHLAAMLIWEARTYSESHPAWAGLASPLSAMPSVLVGRVLSQALGGNWASSDGSKPVGGWRLAIARPRNRVIHRGHRPDALEASTAVAALNQLNLHICDRLAARAREFPRTAVMVVGVPGLDRRGASVHIKATLKHAKENWKDSYSTWLESVDDPTAAEDD